jgi:exodeoxyribonuclease VII large subunit
MQELQIETPILTVSALNKTVKKLLENHFQLVWIEGEISNLSRPVSGHLYFTLKDETAQVRCAMFRTRSSVMPFHLENGMQILACAKLSLYENRGDYQLIIESIEERGEGLLRRQFELLKKQLTAEGLFDYVHKKPIPKFPKQIGIITSSTGAALKDVLSVLKRRFAIAPIIIYPTQVQGEQAARQIVQAINIANEQSRCDVLILCRGGGSLEDLWPFNEEVVARAIFQSQIPIVSGVGHEIDYTIADFVADQRAPTPSAAAELLSPNKDDHLRQLYYLQQRLSHFILTELRHHKTATLSLFKRMLRPDQMIQNYQQTIDLLTTKLHHLNPIIRLKEQKSELTHLEKFLSVAIQRQLEEARHSLISSSRTLNNLSPLNILERGYSITTKDQAIIDDAVKVSVGDRIRVQLRSGVLTCDVVNAVTEKASVK